MCQPIPRFRLISTRNLFLSLQIDELIKDIKKERKEYNRRVLCLIKKLKHISEALDDE